MDQYKAVPSSSLPPPPPEASPDGVQIGCTKCDKVLLVSRSVSEFVCSRCGSRLIASNFINMASNTNNDEIVRNVQDAQPPSNAQPNTTLVGQLLSVKKIFQKPNVSDEHETDGNSDPEGTLPDAGHEEAMSLKRDLFKDSQIYNLLGVKEGSGCSAALIQLFCERYDKERGIFKVNDGVEISFCAHRVADLLSIKHTGKALEEFEKGEGKEKVTRLPLFVDNLKHSLVTKTEKKERKDRNDKDKHQNRIKRELSANSLIQILRRMSVETDEQKEQYKQLVRLFVIDHIFLPSTENAYIRSGNYKYCSDEFTFESINWAQAILDRIYVAVTKNTRTFGACSTAFQALIYDKIPSLVPKDMKTKETKVVADKYPVVRKKKESWKLELDKLNSKDIKNCDLCSRHHDLHDHGLHSPLFQKACEGVILAHVIGKARHMLEGSLEGDYLSQINDFDLVKELKIVYLGMENGSDWGLIEALSMKDAFRFRYKEQESLQIIPSSTYKDPKTINVDSPIPEKTEETPETVEQADGNTINDDIPANLDSSILEKTEETPETVEQADDLTINFDPPANLDSPIPEKTEETPETVEQADGNIINVDPPANQTAEIPDSRYLLRTRTKRTTLVDELNKKCEEDEARKKKKKKK